VDNKASRRVSDELKVNLVQIAYLNRGPKNILCEIQQKVCCRVQSQQIGWNEFKLVLSGTENGVKKARIILLQKIQEKFPSNDKPSIRKFGLFSQLPLEVKQMIIDRVPCEQFSRKKNDGLGLLDVREVSKELKFLADKTLQKVRKVGKDKIFLAESHKSGNVRLGVPPFTSKIIVPTEDLDQILGTVSLIGSKEVHIRCEFRAEWCDSMMELLLKHDHIKPETLTIYGVAGKPELFHAYVAKNPSLKYLSFEKPLVKKNFFKTQFMPFTSKHFVNLGPQDNTPENVRNAYVNRVAFGTNAIHRSLPFGEAKF